MSLPFSAHHHWTHSEGHYTSLPASVPGVKHFIKGVPNTNFFSCLHMMWFWCQMIQAFPTATNFNARRLHPDHPSLFDGSLWSYNGAPGRRLGQQGPAPAQTKDQREVQWRPASPTVLNSSTHSTRRICFLMRTLISDIIRRPDQQGWQGRWGALTSAQRQGSLTKWAPAPSAPSAACLACESRSPGHWPILPRRLGWHAQESSSCSAPRATRVQYRVSCSARTALAHICAPGKHIYKHLTSMQCCMWRHAAGSWMMLCSYAYASAHTVRLTLIKLGESATLKANQFRKRSLQ